MGVSLVMWLSTGEVDVLGMSVPSCTGARGAVATLMRVVVLAAVEQLWSSVGVLRRESEMESSTME